MHAGRLLFRQWTPPFFRVFMTPVVHRCAEQSHKNSIHRSVLFVPLLLDRRRHCAGATPRETGRANRPRDPPHGAFASAELRAARRAARPRVPWTLHCFSACPPRICQTAGRLKWLPASYRFTTLRELSFGVISFLCSKRFYVARRSAYVMFIDAPLSGSEQKCGNHAAPLMCIKTFGFSRGANFSRFFIPSNLELSELEWFYYNAIIGRYYNFIALYKLES